MLALREAASRPGAPGSESQHLLHSVCLVAPGTAGRPLQTSSGAAQGPSGWTTSAARGRKPACFSVPGGRGEGTTAATARTSASPATVAVWGPGRLRVRTRHRAAAPGPVRRPAARALLVSAGSVRFPRGPRVQYLRSEKQPCESPHREASSPQSRFPPNVRRLV